MAKLESTNFYKFLYHNTDLFWIYMNANSGNVSSYNFILPRHQRIDTVMIVTITFTPQKCNVISKKSDSCCPY